MELLCVMQERTDHRSPLHEAVLLLSAPLVQALVSQEAHSLAESLGLCTRNGQTALELARAMQPVTPAQREAHDAIVALLERAEARVQESQ